MHPGRLIRRNFCGVLTKFRRDLKELCVKPEKLEEDIYCSAEAPQIEERSQVYGGQLLAHSICAATETVSKHQHINSLQSYFIDEGSIYKRTLYHVEKTLNGNSFSARTVKAVQDGNTIFSTEVSFHKVEPDSIKFAREMPKIVPPEMCGAFDEVTLSSRNPVNRLWLNYYLQPLRGLFDIRLPGDRPESSSHRSDPRCFLWLKSTSAGIDGSFAHDGVLLAMLTYAGLNAAAIELCSRLELNVEKSATLDYCAWLHRRDVQFDDWILLECGSMAPRNNLLIDGKVWSRSGSLITSCVQQVFLQTQERPALQ